MNKRKASTALAAGAVLGLAVTACSSSSASTPSSASTTAAGASAAKLTACPQSQAPTGGAPGGAPGGIPSGLRGAVAAIPVAKTIKPISASTSTVVDPTGPQIQCGQDQVTTYSNIVYSTPVTNGKATSLKLDLQVPKTAGSKPLVVFITGGGFIAANYAGGLNERTYVAERGYVVASIQYRTITSGATYKDATEDVKSAVRYLRAHAARYGINPGKVALWGQSAGGYLASMAGTTNGASQFDAGANLNQSSDVQAVVDEFGPSDLSKIAADYDAATQKADYAPGGPLAKWVLGPGATTSILDAPAAVAAANPITYISPATPPFLEMQGSEDRIVSPSQTVLMNNALQAKGITSTRYQIEGAPHGDVEVDGNTKQLLLWSTQKVMNLIVAFLHQHLGS